MFLSSLCRLPLCYSFCSSVYLIWDYLLRTGLYLHLNKHIYTHLCGHVHMCKWVCVHLNIFVLTCILIIFLIKIILFLLFFFNLFFLFCFLGLHLWHMEVPSPGVELEQKLLAYATARATPDPSLICDLHCSSPQHQILNPLSEARDQTHILMDTNQVRNLLSQNENSHVLKI